MHTRIQVVIYYSRHCWTTCVTVVKIKTTYRWYNQILFSLWILARNVSTNPLDWTKNTRFLLFFYNNNLNSMFLRRYPQTIYMNRKLQLASHPQMASRRRNQISTRIVYKGNSYNSEQIYIYVISILEIGVEYHCYIDRSLTCVPHAIQNQSV